MAAQYLRRRGLVVVASNIQVAGGELDLIVLDGAERVAVEVRTVTSGTALRQFDDRKLDQVKALAAQTSPRCGRVDFVGVEMKPDGVQIWWLRRVG